VFVSAFNSPKSGVPFTDHTICQAASHSFGETGRGSRLISRGQKRPHFIARAAARPMGLVQWAYSPR
jgi:hypothetical protein